MLTASLYSPLEKFLLGRPVEAQPYTKASCLGGEEFAFQVVLQRDGWDITPVQVEAASPLGGVEVFQVGQVPCAMPAYPARHDEGYLTTQPGLFPDPLLPLEGAAVEVSAFLPPITLRFASKAGEAEATFTLHVVGVDLPPQKLVYTQWFHGDCLADYYHVPVWSEEHWALWEKFLSAAGEEGMNMVLTPLFTPPLDTEIGTERPCVQLLGVEKEGEAYRFDFSLVERFIRMAHHCGMEYFEISHLFTQWGAKAAPAIYVTEKGQRRRAFGWDTPATSPEYAGFLGQLLPALTSFLREQGLSGKVVFHISDEPTVEHLESYRQAKELVKPLLGDFPLYDALSDPACYDTGLVDHPVAATDHIVPFLERQVPGLWAYYCCSHPALGPQPHCGLAAVQVPNPRVFALGVQLLVQPEFPPQAGPLAGDRRPGGFPRRRPLLRVPGRGRPGAVPADEGVPPGPAGFAGLGAGPGAHRGGRRGQGAARF